ncbi:MAG: hypothetical protein EON55_25695 [Alphaproteobacteria bacterium]|nr:MAG: hypothetical protein EON55_25695 [Alphaproteobacteria bacterium]
MSLPDWQVPGTMAHAEYNAVIKALRDANHSVKVAAGRLRIGRSTLYRFISRFEIDLKNAEPADPDGQSTDVGSSSFLIAEQSSDASRAQRSRIILRDGEYHLVRGSSVKD